MVVRHEEMPFRKGFFSNAMQICVREPMPFLLFSIKTTILTLLRDYYSGVQSCNDAKFTKFSVKLSRGENIYEK